MATRKQPTELTDTLDEASSVSITIDGTEDSNSTDDTSGSGSPANYGFLETEKGFKAITNQSDIYNYVFVGTAGEDKIYRK